MSAPKKRTVASLLICAVNQDDKQRLAVLYKAIRFEKKAILEIERKQKRQQKQLEEEEEKVKQNVPKFELADTPQTAFDHSQRLWRGKTRCPSTAKTDWCCLPKQVSRCLGKPHPTLHNLKVAVCCMQFSTIHTSP